MNNQEVMQGWHQVIDGLRKVVRDKLEQYGTGMYEEHSESFLYWAAYFNIRRKTLRLERLTELSLKPGTNAEFREKLIDDYKDIANYAIMAVQILEKDDGV